MNSNSEKKLDFFLKEYERLKNEQSKRIEFRDQMTFVMLGAIGGVFSFAVEHPDYNIALLILPFVCFVIGWNYVTNDEKVTSIGRYIKNDLSPRAKTVLEDTSDTNLFGWELDSPGDLGRRHRKILQFIVDISMFCLSGIISIGLYFWLSYDKIICGCIPPVKLISMIFIALIEVVFLSVLANEIHTYSDLKK
jgi:hypothetical protein